MDVTPDKENIEIVFSQRKYYIDFYQRQYKWNSEPVVRLLDDIFYRFNLEFLIHKNDSTNLETLISNYSWYYLNTYVTNEIDGKLYIVDGQQRLTTLTLILIKLSHLAETLSSELIEWIKPRIVGVSGYNREFWINHDSHNEVLQKIFDDDSDLNAIDTSTGLTSENMVNNYKIISQFIDNELQDKSKFEHFVFYFLKRIILINLNVDRTDVPMIFEVINDRGVRLKSHEILKGKLLGQVKNDELKNLQLTQIWEEQVAKLNSIKQDEIDVFFMYFLRARYVNSESDASKITSTNYHNEIFKTYLNDKLELLHNSNQVKDFIRQDFKYYSELYFKIYTEYSKQDLQSPPVPEFEHVYFNRINEVGFRQTLLILSSCKINDQEEQLKTHNISYQFDRLFSLLQLQGSYDSNFLNEEIYRLNLEIRNTDTDAIKREFSESLKNLLNRYRGTNVQDSVTYSYFRDTGWNLPARFRRYFFTRLERFIAENTNQGIRQSYYNYIRNTGSTNGFHVEHILAHNEENKEAFNNDEEYFERERNRLGGLLLLKGKDNITSSNEKYADKLRTYFNTQVWNETLIHNFYHNNNDFKNFTSRYNLNFKPYESFGPEELEERHRLLFELIKLIWK